MIFLKHLIYNILEILCYIRENIFITGSEYYDYLKSIQQHDKILKWYQKFYIYYYENFKTLIYILFILFAIYIIYNYNFILDDVFNIKSKKKLINNKCTQNNKTIKINKIKNKNKANNTKINNNLTGGNPAVAAVAGRALASQGAKTVATSSASKSMVGKDIDKAKGMLGKAKSKLGNKARKAKAGMSSNVLRERMKLGKAKTNTAIKNAVSKESTGKVFGTLKNVATNFWKFAFAVVLIFGFGIFIFPIISLGILAFITVIILKRQMISIISI